MRYQYRCPECKATPIIEKPMMEASRKEKCTCGTTLSRVYNSTGIKTSDGIKGVKYQIVFVLWYTCANKIQ